jgi:N utilization substance protein A
MASIKLTDQTLKYISLFEGLTNTHIKDCLERVDTLYFIVDTGQLTKAIGKNGSNIKRLRNLLKKNIKIIEYSPSIGDIY